MTATQRSIDLARQAAIAADATGATDLVALDVSEPLPLTDIFVLATGRSERNAQAIADAIEDALNSTGTKTLRREGRAEGRWVLLDFGDVVCHVFHEDDRLFYSLERLWKDCPVIELALPVVAPSSEG